jgi:hypothetical protein
MAQNYTRQSSFADGDTITASLFNNEYNQLVNAFTYSSTDVDATGHRHDGTSGEGGNIYRIGDLNFLNKIEADSVNNRWGFFVEVSSTAVEQIRIQDGVILPVITNDIDLGSATFQFKDLYLDGTANIDSLVLSSGSTVTAILDEDSLVSDSSTALATQQSIKAYVDAQVTAQDLDFQGDTGGALSIDLDSETLTIAGGTGIDTVGATNTLTVSIDSTVATLTGTQTLTNKTIDADNNTVSNLEVDNLKSGVLDTDISSVAGTHTTLPSALAVKTYVDAQVTAQDLDIFGDTGTDAIDLDSETLTFTGGTGITSVVTAGTVTHNIDSTVATLTGTQTLTNKTLTSPDINGGTVDGAVIGGTTAAAGSFTNITVSGTVDGRDVAADGTKLDGIEALADVTDTTNVTAAGALMDSELTNITAVKALNQGVATTDSPSFAGATLTTADINAGTIDGTVIGGTTPAAITGTTITGTSFVSSGNMTFGDSDRAIFGAGSDLQIYHDGSNSYITDTGTGNLYVRASNELALTSAAGEAFFLGIADGSSYLYHNGGVKLNTTATGIDVTGTVTADGLTVDGDATITSASTNSTGFTIGNTAASGVNWTLYSSGGGPSVAGSFGIYNNSTSTNALILSASNNLGLGVAPSAWSQGSAFELLAPGMGLWNGSGSPSSIYMTSNAYFNGGFKYGGNGEASHYYQYLGQHVWSTATSGTAGNAISFTQAMTLDASGNLLVGKTATGFGTAGIELRSGGTLWATASGTNAASFNRLSSDGAIAYFSKDGATVGSIGTGYGVVDIKGGTSGLLMGNSAVLPVNGSGTLTDNSYDIGAGSFRFKDLYLSGGVYLGGTGAANHLDDYEEGTWTPTFLGSGTNPTVTYATRSGIYTKVGNLVTCTFVVGTSANSGGVGDIRIGGLPFAQSSNAANRTYSCINSYNYVQGTDGMQLSLEGNTSVTYWNLLQGRTGASWFNPVWQTNATSAQIYFCGTVQYQV